MNINFLRRDRHTRWQADVDAYVDGELAAPAVTAFERHMAACRACAAVVEQTRLAKAAFAAMPVLQAPRSFAITEALLARAVPHQRTSPGPVYRVAQATAFAALAGFATLVVVDVTRDDSEQPAALEAPAAGIAESAPMDDGGGEDTAGQGGPIGLTAEDATPEDGVGAAGSGNNYDPGQDDAGQLDNGDAQRTDGAGDKFIPGGNAYDGSVPPALALGTEDDGGPAGLRIVQGALAALAAIMAATWFVLRRRHRSL